LAGGCTPLSFPHYFYITLTRVTPAPTHALPLHDALPISARLRRHGGGGSSAPQPYADAHAAREEHRPERQTLGGGDPGRRIRGAPEELQRRRGEAEHDARGITDGL